MTCSCPLKVQAHGQELFFALNDNEVAAVVTRCWKFGHGKSQGEDRPVERDGQTLIRGFHVGHLYDLRFDANDLVALLPVAKLRQVDRDLFLSLVWNGAGERQEKPAGGEDAESNRSAAFLEIEYFDGRFLTARELTRDQRY